MYSVYWYFYTATNSVTKVSQSLKVFNDNIKVVAWVDGSDVNYVWLCIREGSTSTLVLDTAESSKGPNKKNSAKKLGFG